jgi:O-antigen/teichoic acid export membrane protein
MSGLKRIESLVKRFGSITLLRAFSATGLILFSSVITWLYGMDSFGQVSFAISIANLILVIGRYGSEYSFFGRYFDLSSQGESDKAARVLFEKCRLSLILSLSLALVVVPLSFSSVEIIVFCFLYIVGFAIIQMVSLSHRVIKEFYRSYLFEAGVFFVFSSLIFLLLALSGNTINVFVILSACLLAYFCLFSLFGNKKLLQGFKLSDESEGIKLSQSLKQDSKFLAFTLSEYVLFWGIILISGYTLSEYDTGVIAWGGRIFQLFVFILAIRNSVQVPEILASSDIKQSYLKVRKDGVALSVAGLAVSSLAVAVVYFVADLNPSTLLIWSLFALAACVRLYFGPVYHIFVKFSADKQVYTNCVLTVLVCVLCSGLALSLSTGALGLAACYLLTWLVSLIYADSQSLGGQYGRV